MREVDFDFSKEPFPERVNWAYKRLKSEPNESVKELQILAEAGSIMSMLYLSRYFPDKSESIFSETVVYWLKEAISLGSDYAKVRLALYYRSFEKHQDASEALADAALNGYIPALLWSARFDESLYLGNSSGKLLLSKLEYQKFNNLFIMRLLGQALIMGKYGCYTKSLSV